MVPYLERFPGQKNHRQGFSLICPMSSSFVGPSRALMIKAPSGMRMGFAGAPKPLQKIHCVVDIQVLSWNQFRELDKKISTREKHDEWKKKVLKRKLITMLVPLNVKNSGQLATKIRHLTKHFTSDGN